MFCQAVLEALAYSMSHDTGSCDLKDRHLLVCVAFLYTDVLNGGPVNGPSVQLHIQEGQILSTDSSIFH